MTPSDAIVVGPLRGRMSAVKAATLTKIPISSIRRFWAEATQLAKEYYFQRSDRRGFGDHPLPSGRVARPRFTEAQRQHATRALRAHPEISTERLAKLVGTSPGTLRRHLPSCI